MDKEAKSGMASFDIFCHCHFVHCYIRGMFYIFWALFANATLFIVKSGVKTTKEDVNSQSRLKKINALKKSGNAKDATDLLMRYL